MEVVLMILTVPLALFGGFALDAGTADDGDEARAPDHRAGGWPGEDVDDAAEPIV